MAWQPLVEPTRTAGVLADIVAALAPAAHDDVDVLTDRALVRGYLAEDGFVLDPEDVDGTALRCALDALALARGRTRGVARSQGARGDVARVFGEA